jgi:catechol 2,3-dioxygenase-like lactoylglutathione lyase family enzyme
MGDVAGAPCSTQLKPPHTAFTLVWYDVQSTIEAESTTMTMPRLLQVAPYLPVKHVEEIETWFQDVLGFTCQYRGGDPVEFGIYRREACAVMVRRVPMDTRLLPNELQGGTWDAFFWVAGIDALCAEVRSRGATLVYGPVDQPYGVREFAVRGPYGYVFGFGEELERPADDPSQG